MISTESLQIDVRVRLAGIPSLDKALRNLGTFAFVASHLFYAVKRHSSAIVYLLCLIERLEKLHIDIEGRILSPHLASTLLCNVSRRWSLYLSRYVYALACGTNPSGSPVGYFRGM